MNRTIAGTIALAFSLTGYVSPAATKELQMVTVMQSLGTFNAPLFIAMGKGYFKDVGLEVKLENARSGQDAVPLVARGGVDVFMGGIGSGIFSAAQQGLDLQVVGSLGGDPDTKELEKVPSALMVAKALLDSGKISKVADLKGQKVVVPGGLGGPPAYKLGVILATGGLKIRDIQLLNLPSPDMQAALASGAAVAGLAPAPFSTHMHKAGVASAFAVAPPGTIGSGIVYGGKFAKTEAAQLFFNALVRGAHDLEGNKAMSEENLKLIASGMKQDLEIIKVTPAYIFPKNLAPQVDQLMQQQQIYLDAGAFDFDKPLPPSRFINETFSKRAGN